MEPGLGPLGASPRASYLFCSCPRCSPSVDDKLGLGTTRQNVGTPFLKVVMVGRGEVMHLNRIKGLTDQRECSKISPFPPVKQPLGQLPAGRARFHPGPQEVGRPIGKAWPLHLLGHHQHSDLYINPLHGLLQTLGSGWGLTATTCQRGKEPEAEGSGRWLGVPRIPSPIYSPTGHFLQGSAGLE